MPNSIDYPKLAVWPDGYYLTVDLTDVGHNEACALDRNSMLTGQQASLQCFPLPSSYGQDFLGAKIQSREGNSPDRTLRSLSNHLVEKEVIER
jgi:hypothetical protein